MRIKTFFAVLPALLVFFSCQRPEPVAVLTVDPEDVSVNCLANQTQTLKVTSSGEWTVTPEDDYSWVEVSPTTGKGDSEVTFKTVEKNLGSKNRTAYFTFSNGLADDVEVSFKQLKYDESLEEPDDTVDPDDPDDPESIKVSPASIVFAAAGGSEKITVNATAEWTLASSAAWLTATPEKGNDGATVTITAAEYTGSETRNGEITFTMGDKKAKVTVSQAGVQAVEAQPLTLKSGSKEVIIGYHEGDTNVKGATFEWEIEDNGQAFAATVTPTTGATLKVDAANHKISLTIGAAAISNKTSTWTISANIANPGTVEPLILVARQQGYSDHLKGTVNNACRLVVKEVTSQSEITEGTYRITNYGDGWRYCHMMNYQNSPVMFAYNGCLDKINDYLGGNIVENLDGNNGKIYAVRSDGLFDFVSAGDGTFYIRPNGVSVLGLGIVEGKLTISPACKDSKWTVAYASYGCTLCCGDYYVIPGKGSNSDDLQNPVTISTSNTAPTARQHFKVFKISDEVPDTIVVSENSGEFSADGGTAEVTITANKDWTVSSSQDWVTISPESGSTSTKKATVTVAKNTATESRTAELTFTAGVAKAKYTVSQAAGAAIEPEALKLASGSSDVFVGHHEGDANVKGATFEWEIADGGQDFTATVTPSTGATLKVDAANHKISLTIPEAEISGNVSTWTVLANIKNPGTIEPLVLIARQQCYSDSLPEELKTLRPVVKEIKSQDALTDGIYRITNFGAGWRYSHMMSLQANPVKFAYNVYLDKAPDYYGVAVKEGLDGNNGQIKAPRADGLWNITSAGDGKYYVRPLGCAEAGLGNEGGKLTVSRACKDSKWTLTRETNGWVLSCDGYYINAAAGSNAETDFNTNVVTFTTSKSTPSTNNHIKLFKLEVASDSYLTLSKTEDSVSNAAGSFEMNVNSSGAWTASSSESWLTVSPDSGSAGDAAVTVSYTANESFTTRTATITFTAGSLTKTLTVTQAASVKPLKLASGSKDVFVGHHDGDTKISGATFEWEIDDSGQDFTATVTPNTGATLNVDAASHKITLTVPEAEIASKISTWTILANIKNPGTAEPLVLTARQQCFSDKLPAELKPYNPIAQEIKAQADLADGIYRITNYGDGWRYCHMMSFQAGPAKFAYSGYMDKAPDYLGLSVREGLNGGAGQVKGPRCDGLWNITSAGDGKYYIRPLDCAEVGLGNEGGTLTVSRACKDSKWTITRESNGWSLSCDGRYINAGAGTNADTDFQTAVTFTTSKSSITANKHIKLFKLGEFVTSFLTLSKTEEAAANTAGSVDVDVTSSEAWSVSSSASWLTATPTSGAKGLTTVTASYTANSGASSRTATLTFTAGTLSKTLTVTQEGSVQPLKLASGSPDVFVGHHKDDTKINGATFEWNINDAGQDFTATVTPSTGATLKVDAANHKITLTVPEAEISGNTSVWTVLANIKNPGSIEPLVLVARQQCYSNSVPEDFKPLRPIVSEIKSQSDLTDGVYRITNFGDGWRYCHMMAYQSSSSRFAYNGYLDKDLDYLGSTVSEGLDGDNGKVYAPRTDGLWNITSAGDGKYYIRPFGCAEVGLGNEGGTLTVSRACKDSKWSITRETNGWVLSCDGYYINAGSGSNTDNALIAAASFSTSKSTPSTSKHIKLFKLQ